MNYSLHEHRWQTVDIDFPQDFSRPLEKVNILMVCVGCRGWTWIEFDNYVHGDEVWV